MAIDPQHTVVSNPSEPRLSSPLPATSPHLRDYLFPDDLDGAQDVLLGLDDEAQQHMRDPQRPELLELFDTVLRPSHDQDIEGIASAIQGLETARMFDP
jgi:hypothetical protein